MRIILASASPRRKELLEQAGIAFEIQIGNAKECITKEEPGEIVEELSLAKAQKVAEEVTGDAVIIGADTMLPKTEKYWVSQGMLQMRIGCLPCCREQNIRFIRE